MKLQSGRTRRIRILHSEVRAVIFHHLHGWTLFIIYKYKKGSVVKLAEIIKH